MGFLTGTPPPVEPATLRQEPYLERIKVLARHWVDYGAGLPKFVMLIYVAKLVMFAVCGVLIATLTSGLDPLHPAKWWDQPIVYEKLVVAIVLVEVFGIGGAWGPLCGHFKPMTGGGAYWLRPGTIRLPPWPERVPLTRGNRRTTLDALAYLALLAALVAALVLHGSTGHVIAHKPGVHAGRIPSAPLIAAIVLLVGLGLRDKTIFLAARGEQWLPALVFIAFFPFVDMIVAAKLLIVLVWFGAGISKLNRHFENVIPPMVSNTPWNPFKSIKRMHYASFPEDLRPSRGAKRLSHSVGAFGELVPPWILLFSHNTTVTTVAAVFMICYHAFIISTFPLAVPLEWNLMFMYITAFLFLGYPAGDGYAVQNMGTGLLIATVASLIVFPILGELRPRLVSFLPSLRQYSGNWASSMWAFAPGAEAKLDQHLVKPAAVQKVQLTEMYDGDTAELMLHQYLAWRSLHSQGRGLNSVMINQLGADMDGYALREGEVCCNVLIGWNFGDGHLHDRRLIEAVQSRCGFAPGELLVVYAESDPIGRGRQDYYVYDAAVGVVERGTWEVGDAVDAQPWLPDGPIPTNVTYRKPGYERVRHAGDRAPGDAVTA